MKLALVKLALIAAVAENRVIGAKGTIPWLVPEDMQFFQKMTIGHAVIMGRKTYESIGKPLPRRTNIVLSKNTVISHKNVHTSKDIFNAVRFAQNLGHDTVFFAGGSKVYKEAIGIVHTMYITKVFRNPYGDTFFPKFHTSEWSIECQDRQVSETGETFQFIKYERLVL